LAGRASQRRHEHPGDKQVEPDDPETVTGVVRRLARPEFAAALGLGLAAGVALFSDLLPPGLLIPVAVVVVAFTVAGTLALTGATSRASQPLKPNAGDGPPDLALSGIPELAASGIPGETAAWKLLASMPVDGPIPEPGQAPACFRMKSFGANPLFVGRDEELRMLARHLSESRGNPVVVVTGLAGMGKTQLAIEFAHRYGRYFAGGWSGSTLTSRGIFGPRSLTVVAPTVSASTARPPS
jgi:AAA ATPase domain